MNIKKLISAFVTSAMVMTSAVTAYAQDVQVDTDVYQPDRICGYLNVDASTEADIYLKVYMHTPETAEEGYIVYDTVIKADGVHVTDNYVYELEYNSLNIDKGTYDGYYTVVVGVHRHNDNNDPEDIAEIEFPMIVEDIDFSGYETFCNINVNILVDEELEEPICVESGAKPNKTYDMTFSCVDTPEFILYGDANQDENLNIRDAAFIASKLAGGHSDELPECSDINADEKVNVRDAAFIASYMAGLVTLPENRPAPTEPSSEPTAETTVPSETTTTAAPKVTTVTTTTVAAQDPTEAVSTTATAQDTTEAVSTTAAVQDTTEAASTTAAVQATEATETQTAVNPTEAD